MTTLTEAGRRYAEAHDESIVARVALYGVEGGWPAPFVETSIKLMNEEGEREHVCDERDVEDGGDMEFQGHIGAPGYGISYRCVKCDAPRVRLGDAWVDPREHEPIELQPWEVI